MQKTNQERYLFLVIFSWNFSYYKMFMYVKIQPIQYLRNLSNANCMRKLEFHQFTAVESWTGYKKNVSEYVFKLWLSIKKISYPKRIFPKPPTNEAAAKVVFALYTFILRKAFIILYHIYMDNNMFNNSFSVYTNDFIV